MSGVNKIVHNDGGKAEKTEQSHFNILYIIYPCSHPKEPYRKPHESFRWENKIGGAQWYHVTQNLKVSANSIQSFERIKIGHERTDEYPDELAWSLNTFHFSKGGVQNKQK